MANFEQREVEKVRAARARRIAEDIEDQERTAAAMDRAAARYDRQVRRAAAKLDKARELLCDAVLILDEYAMCVAAGEVARDASKAASAADAALYDARKKLAAAYLNGE